MSGGDPWLDQMYPGMPAPEDDEEELDTCEDCGSLFDEDDLNEAGYCHDCAAYHDDSEGDDDDE